MSLIGLETAQGRPTSQADGTVIKARGSQYGELFTISLLNPLQNCAIDGSYFKACNATPGTGIAQSIITTYTAGSPILTIYNNGSNQIILDYIRLLNSVAGTTTTSSDLVAVIDTGNRYSSNGTALTPNNALAGATIASAAQIYFGAVTATAGTSPKIVARAKLKVAAAPCWSLFDQIYLSFGEAPMITTSISSTTASIIPVSSGPVALNPGNSFVLYIYNTANATTAPSWEVEIGWVER